MNVGDRYQRAKRVCRQGAFEERTVEVHQTAEEPVVSKTAHIAEEVVVRKDVTERTETVRDDVRREEVEVQNPTRQNP